MATGRRPTAETPIQQAMEVLGQDGARMARAWQDGIAAMVEGYGDQLRRFRDLGAGYFDPGTQDSDELRQALGRIAEATSTLTEAQTGVATEWLRAPFWLTGAASPIDLQASCVRLLEASREVAIAYLEAALAWQRSVTAGSERAAETVREAIDAQTQAARRLANDAREVQQAAVDATRSTASATRETVNRSVTQQGMP